MAKKEVIAILKSYIFILKSEGILVNSAYLYGSYLTNTATKDSDIDLMIVTDKEYDDYLVGKIWSLTRKVNSKIEPYLVSAKRFNSNDNSPLIDLVKRTGLEIK
jgi:predicted nucleotidyltransferase